MITTDDTRLPATIVEYVGRHVLRHEPVAWLRLDKAGKVTARGGDMTTFDLAHLDEGIPAQEQIPFLAGMLPLEQTPLLLRSFAMSHDLFFDAHLLPGDDADWVLMFNNTKDASFEQLLQQRDHEVDLYRERTERRERDLGAAQKSIADLSAEVDRRRADVFGLRRQLAPARIVDRIDRGESQTAEHFEEATVVVVEARFAADASAATDAELAARHLGRLFDHVDATAEQYAIERVRLVGNTVVAYVGLPLRRPDHDTLAADLARDAIAWANEERIPVAAGLASGALTAALVGRAPTQSYEVWGEPVTTALRRAASAADGETIVE